jgi:hypothetical protein
MQIDLSQFLAGNTPVLLIIGLCVLCLVLPLLLSGLHFISVIIDAITQAISFVIHLNSSPEGCCGCLVAVGACGLVAGVVWLLTAGLANCATYPTNFCALFGR